MKVPHFLQQSLKSKSLTKVEFNIMTKKQTLGEVYSICDNVESKLRRAIKKSTNEEFLVRVLEKEVIHQHFTGMVIPADVTEQAEMCGISNLTMKSAVRMSITEELDRIIATRLGLEKGVVHEVYTDNTTVILVFNPKQLFEYVQQVGTEKIETTCRAKKIVCISDTHNRHGHLKVPEGDILIHAGDFTENGTLEEAKKFNEFMGTMPHPFKIVIAGNHDMIAQKLGLQGTQKLLTNCIYLQDSAIVLDGVKIFGSPWQPKFGRGAFQLSGPMLKSVWQKIPEDTDILVTHSPPKNILDQVKNGKGVGCEYLATKLKEIKPTLHIFGHIHESYGVCHDRHTLFVNASTLNAAHQPNNAPVVCHTNELNWCHGSKGVKQASLFTVNARRERRASVSF